MNAPVIIGALRSLGWIALLSLVQFGSVALVVRVWLGALPLGAARVRYRCALTGLACSTALVVATALWLGSEWRVHASCWTPARGPDGVCVSHGRSAARPPPAAGVRSSDRGAPRDGWLAGLRALALPVGGAGSGGLTAVARALTPPISLLALGCLVAAGIGLTRLLLSMHRLARVRRRSTPVSGGPALEALQRVRARAHASTEIELRTSATIGSPGVVGIRRRTILLPNDLPEALDATELDALLAHEVGHATSSDYEIGLAQLCLEGLLRFNPFVLQLSRLVTDEREALRDQDALRVVSAPRFAGMLLALERLRTSRQTPSGLMPLRPGASLLDRVRRLVGAPRRPIRPVLRVGCVALTLVLTALTVELTLTMGAVGTWAVMDLDVAARATPPLSESPTLRP